MKLSSQGTVAVKSSKKESNSGVFHCCHRSGQWTYLELCNELDSGNEE